MFAAFAHKRTLLIPFYVSGSTETVVSYASAYSLFFFFYWPGILMQQPTATVEQQQICAIVGEQMYQTKMTLLRLS